MIYHYRVYKSRFNRLEFKNFEVTDKSKVNYISSKIIEENKWDRYKCSVELIYKSIE